MAENRLNLAITRLATTLGDSPKSDGELLELFVHHRDESAFETLVRRHGRMVLGVCRRLLRHEQDAEDAFAATFLVLARKAASITKPSRFGNWLFGVAHRTALEAKRARAKRRAKEATVASRVEASDKSGESDLRLVLDEELARLPDKYREVIVFCDLEGRGPRKVAQQLGCPQGTVKSRLARARAMLAKRLTHRGLAPAPGALVAGLSGQAGAAVPALLIRSTVKAASLYAGGKAVAVGVVTANVAALTEGVMKTMLISKLKTMLAVVLAATFSTGGGWLYYRHAVAAEPNTAAATDVVAVAAAEVPKAPEPDDAAKPLTVYLVPPVVVETSPRPGDMLVNAETTKEIRVTFSKRMMGKSWSWSEFSHDTFPKTTGNPYYEGKDQRTCVLPVKLEPGKTYALWLNSERFHNFKDSAGRPAVPYLLVFQTHVVPVPILPDAPQVDMEKLREIGLAMHHFYSQSKRFPANIVDKNGKALLSWRVAALPMISEEALFRQFHLDEPWDSEHNMKLLAQMPQAYRRTGSTADQNSTTFHAPKHKDAFLAPDSHGLTFKPAQGLVSRDDKHKGYDMLKDITDGTSNTLMIVDVTDERAVPWTKPDDWVPDATDPRKGLVGSSPGGFLAVTVDGGRHFIAATIDPRTLRALLTRNGDEVIPDWRR